MFSAEYDGCFVDAATSVFGDAMVRSAFVDDFEPFLKDVSYGGL